MSAEQFISSLVNDGIACQSWTNATFENDFILLSEFSELEGPKPIFTIPGNPSSMFNLNAFAVRIMSVDCVSIMQTTEFRSFNIAGDIQVVLTELSEGAVAYVHHFVLYDIRARGFVRPFCLAYITRHHNELMAAFDTLLELFSTVTALYHFGNSLSFINDLKLRHQHLKHLRTIIEDKSCDIFVEEKILSESQKKNITVQAIDEALEQIHMLNNIFEDYVKRDEFSEHRHVFHEQYNDIIMKNTQGCLDGEDSVQCFTSNDNICLGEIKNGIADELVSIQLVSSEDISRGKYTTNVDQDVSDNEEDCGILLNTRPSHQIPADVMSSILGKKYDKPLRNLSELCDITFKNGLNILKYCLNRFSQDTCIGDMNYVHFATQPSDALMLKFGFNAFTILPTLENTCHHYAVDSLEKLTVTDSDDHKNVLQSLKPTSENSILDGFRTSFLSTLQRTSLSSPLLEQQIISFVKNESRSTFGQLESYVNVPSIKLGSKESFIVLESPSSFSTPAGSSNQSDGSSDSFKDALDSFYPISSKDSTPDSSSGIISYSRSVSVMSTDSTCHVEMNENSPFSTISLLSLRNKYSFLPHAIFSLLIGRPLIVLGEERHSKQIKKLVFALGNFLLLNLCSGKKIIPWTTNQLKLTTLGSYGVVGLSKTRNIPLSLAQYVSVLDYEKQTLFAPEYVGSLLIQLFDPRKHFKTEKSFRHFVQQIFSDLSNTVFVWFMKFYVENEPDSSSSRNYHQYFNEGYHLNGRAATKSDSLILLELLNNLMSQIKHALCCNYDMLGNTTKSKLSIKLNNYTCNLFVNLYNRKNQLK